MLLLSWSFPASSRGAQTSPGTSHCSGLSPFGLVGLEPGLRSRPGKLLSRHTFLLLFLNIYFPMSDKL